MKSLAVVSRFVRVSGVASFARRVIVALGLLSSSGAMVAGCGEEEIIRMPEAVLGTYAVTVEANGKMDTTTMTVVQGSDKTVLLTFADGITPVRCTIVGSTQMTVPRQVIEIANSIGRVSGTATGGGTILGDGTVDVTLTVSVSDVRQGQDGGAAEGGTEFKITGTKS